MTFDLGWHLKVKSNNWIYYGLYLLNGDDIWHWIIFKGQTKVFECLVGCISWIVYVIILICVNNEQIWLPGSYGSDFEQYLNRFQLDPISLWVNLPHELAQIMTTYDFLSAKQAILSNVRTYFNLTQFLFWSTFNRIGTYNDHIWLHMG